MTQRNPISEIIERAGGASAIAVASNGRIKKDAVYKWPSIGIPDRHWPILIAGAGVTAEELYEANVIARATPSQAEERGAA